jgi:putative heme-binding domain-containing protein
MNPTGIGLVILLVSALVGDDKVGRPLEESLLKEDPAVLAKAVRGQGDPARGSAIFFQPALNCAKCHAVGESKGDSIGPDLSKLGREATDAYLIESVLQPSKTVKKGFETVTIATTDGKVLIGLLAEDHPDRLVVRDPSQDGKLVTILKRDIDQRTDGGQSVMPGGLLNGLHSLPSRNCRRRSRAGARAGSRPVTGGGFEAP